MELDELLMEIERRKLERRRQSRALMRAILYLLTALACSVAILLILISRA